MARGKKYAPKRAADLQPVIVHWRDAATQLDHEASLTDSDSMARFGGILDVEDIGFLVRHTRKELVLALGRSIGDDVVRCSTTIPSGWITKVIYLQPEGAGECLCSPPKVQILPPGDADAAD